MVTRYLEDLVAQISVALGPSLRGVYLTGSAATGAYRQGQSDLDVLVTVDDADEAGLASVVARCRHEVLPCPARKLELVVYELAALAEPGDRPRWSLNLNTGPTEHHVGLDPDADDAHWFVIDLAFARTHAVALKGPPATAVIADPGAERVRRAFAALVDWYELNEPQHAATARARAEHWMTTGEFAGKPQLEG